ncbi:MAG: sortase [Anaerolineales bacterium]|nr:sortase [Anaerolineales bacterium]
MELKRKSYLIAGLLCLSLLISVPLIALACEYNVITVDSQGTVGLDTSIALNIHNNPVISYVDGTNIDLKLATCTANCDSDNPTWEIIVVDGTEDVGWYNSLAFDLAGNPVISYMDETNSALKLATCTSGCETSSPTFQVVTVDNTSDVGWYTSLAINGSGNPVISYADASSGDLKLATCTSGCNTAAPTFEIVTVDSPGVVGWYSSLAINLSGNPVISYYSATATALKLATCTAGCDTATPTFVKVTVDSVGTVGIESSLAMTALGNPVISYYDDSNDDLKLATCTGNCNTATPTFEIVTVVSDDDAGLYNDLVLNSNDSPIISYYDATNGNMKMVSCMYDCQTADPTWKIKTVDDYGNVGGYNSLALVSNILATSYYNFSNEDLRFSLETFRSLDEIVMDHDPSAVEDSQPIGTYITNLTCKDTDGDSKDCAFRLVAGAGSTHNGLVQIDGNKLETAVVLDKDVNPVLNLRVEATDMLGNTVEEALSVDVLYEGEILPITTLYLDNETVLAGQPIGEHVGNFICKDVYYRPEPCTLTLVAGAGSAHNSLFNIVGDELVTAAILDKATTPIARIRVQATDTLANTLVETYEIRVKEEGEVNPIQSIVLLDSSVEEKQPAGTTVGAFECRDEYDEPQSCSLSLVAGSGDENNTSFQINGSDLLTAEKLDIEVNPTLNIRVQAEDTLGNVMEDTFVVRVLPWDEENINPDDLEEGIIQIPVGGGGEYNEGRWSLSLPESDQFADGAFLDMSLITTPPQDALGFVLDIRIWDALGNPITQFNPPLRLCYAYTPADSAAVDGNLDLLKVGTRNNKYDSFEMLPTEVEEDQICVTIWHLSQFALFGADKLPATGFTPGEISRLTSQNKMYTNTALVLSIPSLGVETDIVGVPQDLDSWDVSWLGNNAGYLIGTAFPTWEGNTVLTAHVYNADGLPGIFIDLDDLQYGDRIEIKAYGNTYVYEVRSMNSYAPWDTRPLRSTPAGFDYLTLITCKGYSESSDTYAYRYGVQAILVGIE